MMKKFIIFFFLITIFLLRNENERVVIPNKSIRYRIVANSNNPEDQKLKWDINAELIPIITNITNNSSDLAISRKVIKENLNLIETKIQKYTNNYEISFGKNYFPKKEYHNITYSEGEYESLVIKLGKGNGDNWWCVLFPPLCLIEAKKTNLDDITYTSYVKEVINKYF